MEGRGLIQSIYRVTDKTINGFFNEHRYLSNFHVTNTLFQGVMYPSSENAYQAAKSLDQSIRNQFVTIGPKESKKLSRKIEVREDWESVKLKIMYDICMDKFTRNIELSDLLIETGDRYLEESNYWHDNFWGSCYCNMCLARGKNNLGRILMSIRREIGGY